MAPMKRPAAARSSVAKKPKVEVPVEIDPVQQHCDTIKEGMFRSVEVPQTVLNMLSAMCQSALVSCKDERHKYQDGVVDMIGNVLIGIEADINKNIADLESKLSGTDTTRADREAAVKAAEDDLEAKKKETQAKKEALAEEAAAFKSAKVKVSEAQVAEKKAGKELDELILSKDRLESTVKDLLQPLLVEGAAGEDKQHLADSLMAFLQKLDLDESMIKALPEAICKEPSARGSFDSDVVSSLGQELAKRTETAAAAIVAAEPAKAQSTAALQAAEASFASAKDQQHLGATDFKTARDAQTEAESALKTAKKVLADLAPEVTQIEKDLKVATKDLEDFRSGPKSSLAELRERVLPPAEEDTAMAKGEEQGEEAPAAEA